jgi:hypothetical protein
MRVLLQVNCIPAGMITIVTKGDGALMAGSTVFVAGLEGTLSTPQCRTFRISATVFNQPKHSSIRFLFL